MRQFIFFTAIYFFLASSHAVWNGEPAGRFLIDEISKLYAESIVLVKINMEKPRGPRRVPYKQCTGSLITPKHILTAAHCLLDKANNKITGTDIYFPRTSKHPQGKVIAALKWTVHPLLDLERSAIYPQHDVAIIELSTAVDYAMIPLETESLMTADYYLMAGLAVGYGLTNPSDLNSSGVLSVGILQPFVIDESVAVFSLFGNFNQMLCPGDSGGPLFMLNQTQTANGVSIQYEPRKIYGIASAVSSRLNCQGAAAYALVSDNLDFIYSVIQ